MRVGVPREIKNREFRVGLSPAGTRELVLRGHDVLVEAGAGVGVGMTDDLYRGAGADVVGSAEEVFARAELIVKVKEPQPEEIARLRPGHVLFTYLHLAPDPVQARGLMQSGCTAIAYETVTDEHGRLPLLAPMSEVAGRMSVQVGAHCLEKRQGGAGILLGGVPGVAAGRVVVIGGGVSGTNAVQMAVGLGAQMTVLDRSLSRLAELDMLFGGRVATLFSTAEAIERCVLDADLVIGAVLVPGAAAPKLVGRELISRMRRGSVVVDIAIDQGGCFATSHPTTHEDPTFEVDGIVHYCVANMPGGVARTSTLALTNATLPFVLELADKGAGPAMADNRHLVAGLNVQAGQIMHPAVAEALAGAS